jgi:hypothetical protein
VNVWITKGVAVLEGIGVTVRVAVKVIVGVGDAVSVGAVEVGKGPRSTCAVRAMAVLVLLALPCAIISIDEGLRTIQSINMKRAETPRTCR